jgi:phage repressor protein C with HTH and peptisase S24 domain
MCNIVTKRFISCHDELKEKGIIRSSRQFALNLDYLPQSLNEILKGNREVTVDLLRKAIEVYQINPDYLFLGTGGKFKNADFDQGTDNIVHNRNTIKYVPVSVQAGYVDQFHEIVFENELKSFTLPDDKFAHGHYRCFDVAGDSMEPSLLAGDKVICSAVQINHAHRNIKTNHVYVFVLKDSLVVKRLHLPEHGSSHWVLVSDNGFYPEIRIRPEDVRELWHVELRITQFMPSGQQSLKTMQEELTELRKDLKAQHSTIQSLNATIEKLLKVSRDRIVV